ncbi:methyltransferase family protein [Pengzhenrongella sicca]|uniref:Isoprenylcysteine carboxylmethyltransferase family protein n=1 Tax=Pengzhenrongella sicca TaxID=2819238 RepID=A0A8A4ZFH8_9MICO|nr:methyltransferase [Pengzhenrongella sicca]QTE30161.1 isoprenylcysteine carboxylmethyltransferase family protein [Pengzhenrongella sicca]
MPPSAADESADDGAAAGDGASDAAGAAPGRPARREVRTAHLFVVGQFALLALLVALRGRSDWPVPAALAAACTVGAIVGVVVMVIAAASLGRGLTAVPLPNARAELRTGGLYRFSRHPIYGGLLLTAACLTVASGSALRLLVLGLLATLLTVKARWEEARLARRFPGYAEYAARTPRFAGIPRRR